MIGSRHFSVIVIGAGVALAASANGQTNTFPSSGPVGIGTLTPPATLATQGGYNSFIEASGTHAITFYPDAFASESNEIYSDYWSGSYALMLSLGAAPQIHALNILPSGNVGIGTTSPTLGIGGEKLVVAGGYIGVKQTGTDAYGLVAMAKNTDAFIRLGHNGTEGVLGSTYNSTAGFTPLSFQTSDVDRMTVLANGNVGIGTTTPDQALAVNGTVHAKEVLVDNSGWPDWVFSNGQQLPSLSEVERTIREQKYLPGMPSSKDVAAHGVSLGSMEAKLLAQVEQLTLHQIEEEKLIKAEAAKVRELEQKIQVLQKDGR